jgi:hypothetical protein
MHMHHTDKLYALEYMSVTAVFIASFYFRKEIRLRFRNPVFLRETTAGSQVQNTHTHTEVTFLYKAKERKGKRKIRRRPALLSRHKKTSKHDQPLLP